MAIDVSPTPATPTIDLVPAADPLPSASDASTSFLSKPAPVLSASESSSTPSSTSITTPAQQSDSSAQIQARTSGQEQTQASATPASPVVGGNNNSITTTSTRTTHGPITTSVLDRGPLGLTLDEEQWVKDKMEYALYDFQVLALAIKRYKWQLDQVPRDVSRLQSLKKMHMSDPLEFLRQIKNKEFRYPEGQRTLPAPSIEWAKYQFPPANPVVPTRTQRATFLSSVSFTNNRDKTNTSVVSIAQSNNRLRAESPSNDRMRAVKETARSLGINIVHHHQPTYHHHHFNQDAGTTSDRIEANGTEDRYSRDIREPSRRTSQEVGQLGQSYNSFAGAGDRGSNDMEGIIYARQGNETVGDRTGSTSYSVQTSHQLPAPQPSFDHKPIDSTPMAAPQNHTIDHSRGYTPIQSSDIGANSNITYNHMSGSVDIQPNNTARPRGSSREGSGVRDDPKPPLYNIPWSDEEQQLLEKLLEVYPDEPVAAQRFQKISAAMGTRTPKQVASRVQKYFIKLVKAGLEAPGRMNYSLETSKPKSKGVSATAKGKKRKEGPAGTVPGEGAASKSKAARPRKNEASMEAGRSGSGAGAKRKQKAKSLLGSGFGRTSGTQYLNYSSAPTVYMSEADDEDSVQDMLAVSSNGVGSNGPMSSSRRESADNGVATHLGYSCDSCGVEPILGIRYSCIDCEELGGTDLCGLCYNSGQYHNELHLLSHRFQAIESADVPAYSHDYRVSIAGPSGTNTIHHP
ncbi:ZZ-type zinc finger-containing protein 3 [Gamsiella multidivaricata]|nr:ZZ-type zinc finger-containing protein 3 [Gamsiella multidivaricata]